MELTKYLVKTEVIPCNRDLYIVYDEQAGFDIEPVVAFRVETVICVKNSYGLSDGYFDGNSHDPNENNYSTAYPIAGSYLDTDTGGLTDKCHKQYIFIGTRDECEKIKGDNLESKKTNASK